MPEAPGDETPVLSYMREKRLSTASLDFSDDATGVEPAPAPSSLREFSSLMPAEGTEVASEEAVPPGDIPSDIVYGAYQGPADEEVLQSGWIYESTLENQPEGAANSTVAFSATDEPEPEATMVSSGEEALAQPESTTPNVASVSTNAPFSYEPRQQSQATAPQRTEVFATGMLASGPLPSLDGFDELQDLVALNPSDIGAHIALAAAYAQVGDVDTELRVYRRILRRPNVAPAILRLIAEELADYERQLQGQAHYHQIRGDLYMKQHRYQEAIAEYNKIV